MTGRLSVVGIGPGPNSWLTQAARTELELAQEIFGYRPYVDRLPKIAGQIRHRSENRKELNRAYEALRRAASGRHIAVVSGGDPGIFAMASTICEALDKGEHSWRSIEIIIEPGVTAMLAAASRVGAPFGNDFCVVSLSDNLKPFSLIKKRIRLACEGDMSMALYNPASHFRKQQIYRIFDLLKEHRPWNLPVVIASSVGLRDESVLVTQLSKVDPGCMSMHTLVIIGSSTTRIIERDRLGPLVYTERYVRNE